MSRALPCKSPATRAAQRQTVSQTQARDEPSDHYRPDSFVDRHRISCHRRQWSGVLLDVRVSVFGQGNGHNPCILCSSNPRRPTTLRTPLDAGWGNRTRASGIAFSGRSREIVSHFRMGLERSRVVPHGDHANCAGF